MKKFLVIALLCCFTFAAGLWAQAPEKKDAPPAVKKTIELKTPEEKNAYAFGFSVFQSLAQIPVKLEPVQIVQALQDVADSKPKMDEKQKMATIEAFRKYFAAKQQNPEAAFPADNQPFKSFEERISYGIGLDIATQMNIKAMNLKPEIIIQGMNDFATKAPQAMEDKDIRTQVMTMQKEMKAKNDAERSKLAEPNLKAGEKFLAENKTKEGVKTLPSGLQYKVVKEGDGATPKATDTVSVHYRGTLIDGKEFDSSYTRNQPAQFPVNKVIKGWTEILQVMKTGAKYLVFIPANLAYGLDSPPVIPPNSVLIFEIELLKILPAAPAPAEEAEEEDAPAEE